MRRRSECGNEEPSRLPIVPHRGWPRHSAVNGGPLSSTSARPRVGVAPATRGDGREKGRRSDVGWVLPHPPYASAHTCGKEANSRSLCLSPPTGRGPQISVPAYLGGHAARGMRGREARHVVAASADASKHQLASAVDCSPAHGLESKACDPSVTYLSLFNSTCIGSELNTLRRIGKRYPSSPERTSKMISQAVK